MLVLLMRSLDPVLFKDAILLHLDRLPFIDPLRKRYYTDMRKKNILPTALHVHCNCNWFV